jgi:hypothetical protein
MAVPNDPRQKKKKKVWETPISMEKKAGHHSPQLLSQQVGSRNRRSLYNMAWAKRVRGMMQTQQ